MIKEDIHLLRQELRDIRDQLQVIISRDSERGQQSALRLARITGEAETAPGNGHDVFPVIFQDPDETDRQAASRTKLPKIPSDSRLVVDLGQKEWFIVEGAGGTHDVSADEGDTVTIEAGDTLDFDATDLLWSIEANSSKPLRGLVVQVETDADPTIKRLKLSVDKSVLQNIGLSGTATAGTDPVLVRDGTRNSIELLASTTSPVTLTGGAGSIEFGPNDPFHYIKDDQSPSSTVTFDFRDTLKFVHPGSDVVVSKLGDEVTVTLPDDLPTGVFIPSYKEPVEDGGKYYLNRNGDPDLRWALADGVSNAAGSGIKLADQDDSSPGGYEEYFIRALAGTTGNATNNPVGRDPTADTGDVDDDEVEIEVEVATHPDHRHEFNMDACHYTPAGTTTPIHFDFSTASAYTQGAIQIASTAPITLDHDVTLTLTNNQGSVGSKIEMLPPHKKLYWFEKIL